MKEEIKNKLHEYYEKYGEIAIACRGVGTLPIDKISDTLQGNLKKLSDKNLLKLAKSMFMNNFISAFFLWDRGGEWMALDGNARYQTLCAIREAGIPIPGFFPYVEIEASSEQDARQKLLAITSAYNRFQREVLDEWIAEIDPDIAETFALVDTEIELAIASLDEGEETCGDDEVEGEAPAVTKPGDLWELGTEESDRVHRVLCGDSRDSENIKKLMNERKADCVYCDPPYGMHLDADFSGAKSNSKFAKEKGVSGGRKHENVIGDHDDFTPELIGTIFDNFDYCKEIFLWGADYYAELLPKKNDGSWIVWDKRIDESTDKMYGSTFELCWSKKKHKRMIARVKWAGVFGTEKEHDHKRFHPNQKPVLLGEWFFDYFSMKDKKLIVDLYLGSGSSLLSCEKTGRECYGMEYSESFVDVIRERFRTWCLNNNRTPIIKLNGEIWRNIPPSGE